MSDESRAQSLKSFSQLHVTHFRTLRRFALIAAGSPLSDGICMSFRRAHHLLRQLSPQLTNTTRTMSTMKVVQFHKPGGVEVIKYEDAPIPKPGTGEILVKNAYCGVNFIDTYMA